VLRQRLIAQLNGGLQCNLTLIAAPAGFGKTTLLSQWLATSARPTAWLTLDDSDSEPTRFLVYLLAAVQAVVPQLGAGVMAALLAPQPPPPAATVTALINELAALQHPITVVLDDYHRVDSRPVDQAISLLLAHQPPQLHLVIATREDPQLPLARLRAKGQLNELRVADLRFTPAEAAELLSRAAGLGLSAEVVTTLERRTEGWAAGLHLAALSLRGQQDAASFLRSFSGGHRFVLDYLLEEVLQQQPTPIQQFLLHTSILDYRQERADSHLHDALGLLGRLLAAAEAGGRVGSVIEILLLQALAHEVHGDFQYALVPLARALVLAEPEGYVRLFVDEGPPLARLLRRMQEEGGKVNVYLHTLLAAFGRQPDLHPTSFSPPPSEEPLSEREREVLRLIAEGLSNQELAARLYLSPHTIKVHTRKIYGKLGITSRTQALARARALGILDLP
jgi:ATP/maltotriose-dependent transcriptional regulator MalT